MIPSPNVAEDHQTKNAKALAEQNAAVLIPDNMISKELIDKTLSLIADVDKRKELSENIFKMAEKDADKHIAEVVFKLIEK